MPGNPLGYHERELTKRVRDHNEVFDLVDPVEGRAKHDNPWPEREGWPLSAITPVPG